MIPVSPHGRTTGIPVTTHHGHIGSNPDCIDRGSKDWLSLTKGREVEKPRPPLMSICGDKTNGWRAYKIIDGSGRAGNRKRGR